MYVEHPNQEALQRYFDGELPAAELPALQAHLATCAECKAQIAALTRLRALVTMAVADGGQQADFERMFANVERGIAAGARPVVKAAPVTNLLFHKLGRLSNAVPALGAVALAAAVMLMLYRPDAPQSGSDEPYEVQAAEGHSEIVEVDFGSNAGTVFDISLSDGSSSPVVWIDDDDDDDEPDNENQE
jgi:anti-sigma factor RsiW